MFLLLLIFIGVFVTTALLFVATGAGAAEQLKKAMARLDSVLLTERAGAEELVDLRKQELLSAIPWLNRFLIKLEVAPKLRRLLYQADSKWTPATFFLSTLACWLIGAFLIHLRIGNSLVALLLGLVPGVIPFLYVLNRKSKRFRQFELGLPAALDLMVSGLRAGQSMVPTLGLVGREAPDPIGREFNICFEEQNYGLELRTALGNLVTRFPLQDLRMIASAIMIQRETGGNLAEILDKCAHIIRARAQLQQEIRVRTAQGRLTGWILSFLPVILGVILYFMNPAQMSVLWKRPLGVKLLYTSAAMTTIGALIIRKIVRIRV